MYKSEQELHNQLLTTLVKENATPWGALSVMSEFFFVRGRTDVVALTSNQHIIAFEVKLTKWREALHQAYRNTCFAHSSYIVVPQEIADRIIRFEPDFHRFTVGLCYVSVEKQLIVSIEARNRYPIQPWLTEKAITTILRRRDVAQAI